MSRRSSQRFLHSARDRLVISHFTLGKSLKWHFALDVGATRVTRVSLKRRLRHDATIVRCLQTTEHSCSLLQTVLHVLYLRQNNTL